MVFLLRHLESMSDSRARQSVNTNDLRIAALQRMLAAMDQLQSGFVLPKQNRKKKIKISSKICNTIICNILVPNPKSTRLLKASL